MDTTKAQQKALDDALVAPENRLKIGKCNQCLSPTLKSNEPTIQVALDALKLTPFYNAFEVSADVSEIYMQEFWATITKHHFSLRIKMNGKSHTVNVDNFRDMLKICPKLPGQKCEDPLFEEEILSFIRDLGHTDLVYQVENKNSKKNNDMYYPRYTKVIVDYFMAKDHAIPRRNKMFWHYARDDLMFTIIRVISKHHDTQVYVAIIPQHLTNQAMLESEAYKTYRAYAIGEKTPKPKSTKKKADSKSSPKTKPTQASKGKRIMTSAKGVKIALERSKTQQHISHASGSGADEGTGVTPRVPDVPSYDSETEQISWKSSDEEDDDEVNMGNDNDDDADNKDDDDDKEQDDVNEQTDSDNDGDEFVHPKLFTPDEEDKEEEDSDPRVHTPSNYEYTDDEESDEEIQGTNVEGEEMDKEETNEEDEANELYSDMNVNLEGRDTEMTDAPCTIVQTTQVIEDTYVIITPVNPEAQQQNSSVSSGFVSNMLNPSLDTIPTPPTAPSSSLQDLPNFGSLFGFDHRLKTLEIDFSELKQTNQFTASVSLIPDIVDKLRDEAQAENADFINKLDDNIKKIIKDQVKEQVKAQVFKILSKIEKNVNEQLKAEVLTRSSNESKTSHAIAANLSELERKKILIEKMESNKRRDEEDKDEEPSARLNRRSKRRRVGKEPESTSAPKEKTPNTNSKSTEGSKSHHKSHQVEEPMQTAKDLEEPAHQEFETRVTKDQPDEETSQLPDWFQKPAKPPTPNRDWNKTFPDSHGPVQPWPSSLAQMEDPRESFNELMDTPLDFSAFVMNRLKVDTLTLELLAVYKETTNQLDWNNPEGQQYPHDLRKPLPLIPNSRGRRRVFTLFDTSQQRLAYLNDDQMYTFKEGRFQQDFSIQGDIEDMLLLFVQGKLINLTVEERLAFNVSLRMFTRSVVIQRRVEDLQLGVESYQKKLNLTKPDTYRSDHKRKEAYIAYSNPKGFIYHNKDKKYRFMRIDELHKFSDGTLNDVQTALDDRLKGIQIKYLPQTIWRQSDRDKAGVLIQAIDKQLKTRRIMRSLEKFVGGRPYEGDFRLLQRTI
ncbi:hypothetical protein Tco_0468349 [Tanacetum coccineum]